MELDNFEFEFLMHKFLILNKLDASKTAQENSFTFNDLKLC